MYYERTEEMSRARAIAQVRQTLARVLSRGRFGFEVDENANTVHYAGYKFWIMVGMRPGTSEKHRERQDWIHINVSVNGDDNMGREFFHERFPAAHMGKVRKLGLILAKKIQQRPVHDIMAS